MSHDHDGKSHCVARPTVTGPMSEKTGQEIIKKLDELSDQMVMVVSALMDLEHQIKSTGDGA